MKRTTVILGILAAAMLAFILIYERGTMSSREIEQRRDRVLQRFVKERVSRLEIERGGETTLLVREPDEEGGLELGDWEIRKPFSARADQEVVEDLLGELEWLGPERRLSGLKKEDGERFGFDAPRIRAWFTVGDRRVPITIGKPEPRGAGVYLQLDDPGSAFVVGEGVVKAFDHDPGHFHTKELHEGLSIYTMQSLTLRDENGERVVEKRGDDFWLSEPFSVLAFHDAVEEVVDCLDELRARRFVSERIDDPAALGLEAPVFEALLVEKEPGEPDGKSEAETSTLRLRLGGACEGREKESYLAVGDDGPVFCVADADLVRARKDAEALRDRRLLAVRDRGIESVVVASGSSKLELSEKRSQWSFRLSREGKELGSGEADAEAVAKWLKELRAVEAIRFLPADDDALRDHRIDKPSVVLTVKRAGKSAPFTTRVGRGDEREMAVRRGDEPLLALFPASASELLRASSARFRRPGLLNEAEDDLTRLEIRRGDRLEKLERKGEGAWSIEEPLQVEADPDRLSELAGLLSSLKAQRFVADIAEPEHGLDYPALEVKAFYKTPPAGESDSAEKAGEQKDSPAERHHLLAIGGETEGGRYARLDADRAVFVLSESLSGLLSEPLVSRALLSTPVDRLQSVKIAAQERMVEVTRRGDAFSITGSESDAGGRATALAERVAGLRAVGAAYGYPGPEQGFDPPLTRITVARKKGSPEPLSYELLVGADASSGSASAPVRYVRRGDLAVVFTVPAADLAAFLED